MLVNICELALILTIILHPFLIAVGGVQALVLILINTIINFTGRISRIIIVLLVDCSFPLLAFTFLTVLLFFFVVSQLFQDFLIASLLFQDSFFFFSFVFALNPELLINLLLLLQDFELAIFLLFESFIFSLLVLLKCLLPILEHFNNKFNFGVGDFFHFVELGS